MTYEDANEVKANFDNVYTAPTPHAYLNMMTKHGYEIGDQARPYCAEAVKLLSDTNGAAKRIHMLDVGCSYGIGALIVKYGRSFREVTDFVRDQLPRDYDDATEAMRTWLNGSGTSSTLNCVGLDSSEPAIRFAVDAGLLDGGIPCDLENATCALAGDDRDLVNRCNLMMSTGAIGYVTETTLNKLLPEFGARTNGDAGRWCVVTILRMFDTEPVQGSFERHGFKFGQIPDVCLRQRRFADDEERAGVLDRLHERGLDTARHEDDGHHYANLYIATPPDQFHILAERLSEM